MSSKKVGLIINPIAGVGGRVGLKGSDGVVEKALALGSIPLAQEQALRTLKIFEEEIEEIYTIAGNMGEDIVQKTGLNYRVVYYPQVDKTKAEDTERAAEAMLKHQVDMLLFAGGDGTVRDILKVIGNKIPLIGIPAGVKMYSGVFAMTPTHAGMLTKKFLHSDEMKLNEVEVLDINEDYMRIGRPETSLYGYALTFSDAMIQVTKSSQKYNKDNILDATCHHIAKNFEKDIIHIIGPGSTMQSLKKYAVKEGTLLGVDVIHNGKIILQDAKEKELLTLLKEWAAKIYIGVIGGTGCLFGRGNQQISANVLEKVEKDHIIVISSTEKLIELGHEGFFVDTGNQAIDQMLKGYIQVQVGINRQMMMQVT